MIQPSPNISSQAKARFKRWLDAAPEILEAVSPVERTTAREVFDRFKKTCSTVLVEIHHDGFVKVFGDTHVQVKIINVPYSMTIEGETMIEEWIDSILPSRYQQIRWPGQNQRACGNARRTKLSDVQSTIDDIQLLYSIGDDDASNRYRNGISKQFAALEA